MARTTVSTSPTVTELGQSFLRGLRAANKAPSTQKIYGYAVKLFDEYLVRQGMPQRVSAISREHVESFITEVLERRKPATASAYYRGLQQFFKWCAEEGEIKVSPMVHMKPPKLPEAPPPVPTDDELRRLLKACEGTGFEARRDTAIVSLFLDSGLRRSELAGLTFDDVDLTNDVVRVVGKGNRIRGVPFGHKTAQRLDRYLRIRRQHPNGYLDQVWIGHAGPLTSNGVYQLLVRRAKQAGIELFPHQLRHAFADRWLATDGAESDLMRLTGWKSRSMVSRYAAARADERARESYQRRQSPADAL
ncbi:MAG: tyrosine-type recombinase/integrase [Chloroflexi bacterium]|nr:tyrosine-type recombinase/integrase [Chloroflexota bacterium]